MLGLLNAYRQEKNAPAYQLEYGAMFLRYLSAAMPGVSVKEYEVALSGAPKNVQECDSWIITGSPRGAYEQEAWIEGLGKFIQDCDANKRKLVGVCFGHQMIAHFLGGRTEKSQKGWGVGVRGFQVVGCKPWMQPKLERASLLFSHQDQVVELPPRAELLAKDDFCPYQMFSIDEHIFSLQGHPEFTPKFARERMDMRVERIGRSVYTAALGTLEDKTNSQDIGEWIRRFLAHF